MRIDKWIDDDAVSAAAAAAAATTSVFTRAMTKCRAVNKTSSMRQQNNMTAPAVTAVAPTEVKRPPTPQFATFASFDASPGQKDKPGLVGSSNSSGGGGGGAGVGGASLTGTTITGKITGIMFPNFIHNRMFPVSSKFQIDGRVWFRGVLRIACRDLVTFTILVGKRDTKDRSNEETYFVQRIVKMEAALPTTKDAADEIVRKLVDRQRFSEHTNEGKLARHMAETTLMSAVLNHFKKEQECRRNPPRPFQLVPCLVKEASRTDIPPSVPNWAEKILNGVENADYLIALRYSALLDWFPFGELCQLEWENRKYLHDELLLRTPLDVFYWPCQPSQKQQQQKQQQDQVQPPPRELRMLHRIVSRVSIPAMVAMHNRCLPIVQHLLINDAKMTEQDFCNAWFYHVFETDQVATGDTAIEVFDYDPQRKSIRMSLQNMGDRVRRQDRETMQSLFDRLFKPNPNKGIDIERMHAPVAFRLIEQMGCIEVRRFFDPRIGQNSTFAASPHVFARCDAWKRFVLDLEKRRRAPQSVQPMLKPPGLAFEADAGQRRALALIFDPKALPVVIVEGRAGTGKTEILKFIDCKREVRADPEEVKKKKKEREKKIKEDPTAALLGEEASSNNSSSSNGSNKPLEDEKWKSRATMLVTAPTNAVITSRIRRHLGLTGENCDYMFDYWFHNRDAFRDRYSEVELLPFEETSMNDEKKFLQMEGPMRDMPKLVGLLVLGDTRQLASVAAGSPLRDVIEWKKHTQHVVLQENHRVAKECQILNRVNDAVLDCLRNTVLPLPDDDDPVALGSAQFTVEPFAGTRTVNEIFEKAGGQPGMINCHIIALRNETCRDVNLIIMKLCKFIPEYTYTLPTHFFVGQKVIFKDNLVLDTVRMANNQLMWIDEIYDENKATGERTPCQTTSEPLRFRRRADGCRKIAFTRLPLRDDDRKLRAPVSDGEAADPDSFVLTWSDELRYNLAAAYCSTCNSVQGLQAPSIYVIVEPDVADNKWIYTAFSRPRQFLRVYVCPPRVWNEDERSSKAQSFDSMQPLSQAQAIETLKQRIRTVKNERITALSCVLFQE